MKKIHNRLGTLLIVTICSLLSFAPPMVETNVEGAWYVNNGGVEQVLLFQDGYFSHTTYSKADKKFMQTNGGAYKVNGESITIAKEFDTRGKETIGQSAAYNAKMEGSKLSFDYEGKKQTWARLGSAKEDLAGTWKISGRKQDGVITKMNQTGPRKTLKIITGGRFQWAAINPETKEFFGTGGGNYTFANGKYTENIEFFSRDSSRVGASLSFDGNLIDGDWHHSGKSSRGEDIYEVWSRINR